MKLFATTILIFFFISCKKTETASAGSSQAGPPKAPSTQVEAIIADYQEVAQDIKIPGRLVASEQIEVHPELSAQISRIYFKDAQIVIKNQLLAELKHDEVSARLSKLKIQEELFKSNEQRQQELYKNKAIGQSEYEASLLQYRNVISDIKITEAELRKYSIRAPFSGTLGFRNISLGDYVNTSTIITTLTQTYPLKLRLSVPEQYSNRLKLNQIIKFQCENSNKQNEAKIQSFAPFLNEESKTLDVLAIVTNKDNTLRPGSYASVELNLEKKASAIFIPSQCIIPRIKDKQVALYKSNKVQFSTVTLGFRDSARVEILSGVNKGDTILSTGLMRLKPGMPVNISKLNSVQ